MLQQELQQSLILCGEEQMLKQAEAQVRAMNQSAGAWQWAGEQHESLQGAGNRKQMNHDRR